MKKRKPYGMTTPSDNCPFRTDVNPYITAARVREIEDSLERGQFYCHKTTDMDRFDGEEDGNGSFYNPSGEEQDCAGALILLEKEERPSQMMRISERLGFYDMRKLNMDAPVYDSFAEMIEAHQKRRRA